MQLFTRARWLAGLLIAVIVALGCGPGAPSQSDDIHPALQGGIIPPADQRPDALADFLDLPDDVDPVVFPWSRVEIEPADGGEPFAYGILVANSSPRRTRGLMHWTGLPEQTGMLFIFRSLDNGGGFWNRDVPIDLDVAFLDADGVVLEFVRLNARSEEIKRPEARYAFALEAPAGRFASDGVSVGARIVLSERLRESVQ